MILHGNKKKILKEVIRYYVETTDKKYDEFILEVSNTKGKQEAELSYSEWLAMKSYEVLKRYEITMSDCIENKDIINASINEESSRAEGEFYTPEVWCADGRSYLKEMLGDQWGKAYVWDASCGSGNLMRTEGYPTDKLFMSSLLPEDIEIIKATPEFEGVEAFQGNFVNGIDWDDRNMHFSETLPPRLRQVLENDEPIVFYMNPPYKVMEANSSDVGAYMASNGMAKCALDIFHQFMYRMVMIKRTYNLTNCYMGIFGPVTMFHSKMIEPMYNEFKEEFKFHSGMCFDAGDFSNTSESVGWIVGYTAWRSKQAGEEDKSIMLEAKTIGEDGMPKSIGSRLITSIDINLHNWVEPKDVVRYDGQLPMVTTFNNFYDQLHKTSDTAFGYMMSSNYVIRATRRACVTSLPTPDTIPVTPENFWRCVASFAARRCYASKQNPYNNCQYYSMPDTSVEGYDQWLADALVIFLFDSNSHPSAYRGIEQVGQTWDIANGLFPISQDIVRSVVTDPVILADMDANPVKNQELLKLLEGVQDKMSPDALELYQYSLQLILESLHGTRREEVGYADWTNAWDAGLLQIRHVKGLLTTEQKERYNYLLSKLKNHLYDGIYKYGFLMDTAFVVEEDTLEEDDNLLGEELEGAVL